MAVFDPPGDLLDLVRLTEVAKSSYLLCILMVSFSERMQSCVTVIHKIMYEYVWLCIPAFTSHSSY